MLAAASSTERPDNFRTRLRFRRQAERDGEATDDETSGSDVTGSRRNDTAGGATASVNDVDYDLYAQYLDYVEESERTADDDEAQTENPETEEGNAEPKNDEESEEVSQNSAQRDVIRTTRRPSGVPTRRRGDRRRRRSTTAPPDERQFNYNSYNSYESVREGEADEDDASYNATLFRFLPLIVMTVSGAVCYFFARVACKLCMQEFGVSLPLTLITPATVAIFCYLCQLQHWTRVRSEILSSNFIHLASMILILAFRLPDVFIGYWKCSEPYTDGVFQWQVGCALGLWWLSQMWVTGHIWVPKCERLAKAER